MPDEWCPKAWQSHPLSQGPLYLDNQQLEKYVLYLEKQRPLVSIAEIQAFQHQLETLHAEKGFLLQAGDCAETFAHSYFSYTVRKVDLLATMHDVISPNIPGQVIVTGRMAGQFAKPRSCMIENIQGMIVPNFQGEIINGQNFEDRKPDPERMLKAYSVSNAVLEDLRSLNNQPHPQSSLQFANNLFIAHEAYLLPYEQGLVRPDPKTGDWYATSAHCLWIGERTRQIQGAHIAFARGIANPIGVKIGPSIHQHEVDSLIKILNPSQNLGKLIIICRFGADAINGILPKLLRHFLDAPVLWMCDPMHGNTRKLSNGIKTRNFDAVCYELAQFMRIVKEAGLHPSGLHCEITPESVTECYDPANGIDEEMVPRNYTSACDPRLNKNQAIELARLCGEELAK